MNHHDKDDDKVETVHYNDDDCYRSETYDDADYCTQRQQQVHDGNNDDDHDAVIIRRHIRVGSTTTRRKERRNFYHSNMKLPKMLINTIYFLVMSVVMMKDLESKHSLTTSFLSSSTLSSSIAFVLPVMKFYHRTCSRNRNSISLLYATAQTPYQVYDQYHHDRHHRLRSTRSNQSNNTRRRTTTSTNNHSYKNNHYFATLLASRKSNDNTNNDKPWRQNSKSSKSDYSKNQQQQQQYRRYESSHILDYRQVMNDKRAQIYNVNFRSRRPNDYSWTTYIVVTTILSFLGQTIKPSLTASGMKISYKIRTGQELYRLITPILLHGNIFHLMTNMVSLQRVGHDVERIFGPARYLYTYLLSGIMGNIVSAYQSPNPSLGASGSVFGVIGAYFIFANQNEWILGNGGHAITSSIIQTIGMNVLLGFMNPSIDQWAHAGGFLGGAMAAYFLGPKLYMIDPATIPISSSSPLQYRTQQRIIVDKPIIRLPTITIPNTIQKAYSKYIMEPIDYMIYGKEEDVNNYKTRPWLNYTSRQHRRRRHQKRMAPNQSIKPMNLDDV